MLQNLPRFPAFIDKSGNKVPIIDNWQKQATNDPAQIKQWYDQYNGPNFFWGIPTGEATGIYAFDIDVKKGRDGFKVLDQLGIKLPLTISQKTISGGVHLIFKYPKGSNLGLRANLFKKETKLNETGLDTRGEGGWIADYGFTQMQGELAPTPQWLIEAGKKREITEFENGSNYVLSPEVAQIKINEILKTIVEAPAGAGNQTLNDQAFEMGRIVTSGAITVDAALKLLIDAGTYNNRRTEYEATETAKSGLEGGLKVPLNCPFDPNPKLLIPVEQVVETDWTPKLTTFDELTDESKLKQPQLFKDWSSCDISLLNAEGGTGKTTLLLYESVCLRLGDNFMGFENLRPNGKTLYITGEDTAQKLKAILGRILKQMGILEDRKKVDHILNGVFIKKDADMCLVVRDKSGVFHPNPEAYQKIANAVRALGVCSVKIDALANFWGPESQVNDMSRGVIKFFDKLKEEFGIQVEAIHHLGADGSKTKEMGQFSGRGGSVFPSHSRVVKTMRPVMEEEKDEYINFAMEPNEKAILCNVGKFSDGSSLLNKPFLIIRNGYLFKREIIGKKLITQAPVAGPLCEKEVLAWMLAERSHGRRPTKNIIRNKFLTQFPKDKIDMTLETLTYFGFDKHKIKLVDDPTPDSKAKVYIVLDEKGNEI